VPVIVVGGSGKGVGKTAFICGLIAVLREFAWTAVKITSDAHGEREPIWEETAAGQATDTARYLAAGAGRALLVSAQDDVLSQTMGELWSRVERDSPLIFESNRIVDYVQPDLCLAVDGGADGERKPSFEMLWRRADATILRGPDGEMPGLGKPVFHLAAFDRVSPPLQQWVRARLMPH
jgi:hypothetical protein